MDQPLSSSAPVDLARVARLVRPFEAFEPLAVRRPDGGWSIGYGHVRSAREGAQVTRDEADALLLYDLRGVAEAVRSAIFAPINSNQLEAFVAFAFHIGAERFQRSTALVRFNAGDDLGAAQEIERWCKANLSGEPQVVDALVRRRAAEKAHFLTPPEGYPKASRVRLQPQFQAGPPSSGLDTANEGSSPAPSAALAAADNVSARLRALVPDVAERDDHLRDGTSGAEPPADPSPAPATGRGENTATCDAPVTVAPRTEPVFDDASSEAPEAMFDPSVATSATLHASHDVDAEIPPPPMPFDVEPATTPLSPLKPIQARAQDDDGPPFALGRASAHDPVAPDPFGPDPDEEEEGLSLKPAADLSFSGRPPHAEREQGGRDVRGGAPVGRPSRLSLGLARLPATWLWGCIVMGLATFGWSTWSIFQTSPGPTNFIAGVVAILAIAVPAYLLSGRKAGR